MTNRLQVIPLNLLLDPQPQYSRRGRVATARLWLRTAIGWAMELEQWHWCLGFALCTSLIGGILLVCSINPYGISMWLLLPGIVYPLELNSPNTRQYQAVGVLIVNYSAFGITALAYAFYHSYA
jgi:hypothetical protein